MKIFNTDQIRRADKITIQKQQISGLQLMERAGFRLFTRLQDEFLPAEGRVLVFCGTGNNGGDGLVIARYLREKGCHVEVFVVNFSRGRSSDMQANLDRYVALEGTVTDLYEKVALPVIRKDDLVIDAVFGIGLNRRPPNWVEMLFKVVNASSATVVSVDIPSGLYMDGYPEDQDAVIRAGHTYTFELPKLPFLLPDTGRYTQDWSVVPIGQDQDFISSEATKLFYTDQKEMAAALKWRSRFSHKGTYGHVLVVGGSYGKIGAALMSAEAALTAGSGLVSALVPQCGYTILQTSVPEVMCLESKDEKVLTYIEPQFTPDAVALGPGMGTDPETAKAVFGYLKHVHCPVVIDADALNMLASHSEMWSAVPQDAVLTPHPGEFKRLAGDWKNDRERLDKAMNFAAAKKVVLVLKGAYTAVTNGEQVFFNSTGNPGMATGGSGDVLTGIITSLLGQGYDAMTAARLGVYLHGLSADIAIRDTSEWSLTATDIIDYLGDAFLFLASSRR